MDKKRKKYLVTDGDTFACSLVDDPAIEMPFLAFSSEETSLHFSSDEKHNVTGPVAIPNLPIYRLTPNGEEYDIVFSEEAIEKMSQNYLKNFRQMNVNLMHDDDLAQGGSAYLVEQWLINDPDNDKANAMGFKKLPKGTWMQTYHIDSIDTWERIRSGELRGFSIECAVSLEEFDRQVEKQEEQVDTVEEPTTETVEQPKAEEVEEPTTETVEESKTEEEVESNSQETPETPKEEVKNSPQDEIIKNLLEEVKALKEQISELNIKPSAKPINVQSNAVSGDSYKQWREQIRKYM